MSVIHRVDVNDGSLLDIVSGMESTARRFDGLLDRYVPGAPTPGVPDDPRTLDLLLGLVAVRERLRSVFARSATETSARDVDKAPSIDESWLR